MKDRLVAILVAKGLLNKDLIESVDLYMDRWKVSSYVALLETKMISESQLADCLAELLKIERVFSIDLDDIGEDSFKYISFRQAHTWAAFPIGLSPGGGSYTVILADPTNLGIIEGVNKVIPQPVTYLVGESKLVKEAINKYFPIELQIPNILKE